MNLLSSRESPYTIPKFAALRISRLGHEITALRAVVAEMLAEFKRLQAREKSARHLAFHDELTSLPNRRYFFARLERALAPRDIGPPPFAVIYLDLDGFKPLNDRYGHDAGHAVLNIVAARLVRALHAEDFVGRLGGDEYACLITGTVSPDRLRQLALTLLHVVSAPIKLGLILLTVRPSIGIAVHPTDGSTSDALLRGADAAMYRAKRDQLAYAFAAASTDVGIGAVGVDTRGAVK